MKIKKIIEILTADAPWVDYNETRDIMLFGDDELEVDKIGVCWVATNKAIEQAVKQGIHFIISHENPFYHMTTGPKRLAHLSVEKKRRCLQENNIHIYRCHDLWDKIPKVGVADVWARRLGYDFKRNTSSYIQHAAIKETTVRELASHVAEALKPDGENGVYIFGDPDKKISAIGMGTGAATDIFKMLDNGPCDVCIVADDGISNFYQAQYAIDNGLPLIVVNHACCEIAGIRSMADYLKEQFPELEISYLEEGYTITHITV